MKISCSKYIILLLILPFYVLFAYQSIAEITNVIGQVYCSNHRGNSDCYRYDDAQKLIVHSGKSLHEGDKIFVMQKGKANIVFRNGNTIKQINGEIEIDPDEVTIENGFFQGFFAFLMGYEGINSLGLNGFLKPNILIPAALSSVMLMGSYPMTQIYQHEEDERHGDKTISMVMGVRGTFLLTAVLFVLASSGFFVFFEICFNTKYAILFLAFLSPALVYFLVWFWKVNSDGSLANYGWAMWLNFISATCLNGFFIYFFLDHSQVLQAVEGGY